MDIDALKEALKSSNVTVAFTKKDGTKRVMRCTQNPNVTMQAIKEGANNLITVWDLDNDAWRSFYVNKIIMWSI